MLPKFSATDNEAGEINASMFSDGDKQFVKDFTVQCMKQIVMLEAELVVKLGVLVQKI